MQGKCSSSLRPRNKKCWRCDVFSHRSVLFSEVWRRGVWFVVHKETQRTKPNKHNKHTLH